MKKQSKNPTRGKSSDILQELYGDTSKYKKIMQNWASKLKKQYPNKHLSEIFDGLATHIITIMPMIFCDALANDLGKKVDDKFLAAIGLSCLLISTHDDVVDEMPKDRIKLAALVYAGNIAALEGIKLFGKKNFDIIQIIIDPVAQNHYLQQLVVEKLWNGNKISPKEYFVGIKHICVFTSIGPLVALALTQRKDLKKRILNFSSGYGLALQLLDDLREIDEDKINGYISLPLLEGSPYTKTLKELYINISKARSALNPSWKHTGKFVDNIKNFAKDIERQVNG